MKKGVCELGKGIRAEHEHIIQATYTNRKRFDQLELHHLLLENHMKDIHSALKGLMNKAKVIAEQTNRIEADLGNQRRHLEDNVSNMRKASVVMVNKKSGNFDSLFGKMDKKITAVNNEIKKLREAATQNDRKLHDLTSNLRQHKDHIMSQVVGLEQKLSSLIEHQLQEARRNFDDLKSEISGFQGSLKGMDGLLVSANEKMKSLYGDLERYKKAVTAEMHRLAKDIGEAAGGQVLEITKAHNIMKKQMEGLLADLSGAQLDAKAITARMNDIENELTKKTEDLMREIKKAAREANTSDAIRTQKAEQFYSRADEDLKHLTEELENIKGAAAIIIGKADELENRTRQKLDELKGELDEVTAKLEKISAGLLEEFYMKMQRGAEQLQGKLSEQHNQLMQYIDSKIESQAKKHADDARDQAAEIHLKMEHSDMLAEATRLQLDKIFYILILLIIMLPMLMYTAYMGRTMTSTSDQPSAWWQFCSRSLLSGKRDHSEL
ncbi:myosin-4-like [Watersipora subatra]|uniref:myosin-4-like n=1 Tax=Watersipora subatra TaxID=2589382 RepID=UPI00355AD436